MIFKYSDYKKFLEKLKSKGNCVTFSEWSGLNSFLLRFDVDFDLKKSLILAKINQEYSIKSTFFVLTSSDFYNVLTNVNRKILKEISNTGAEIGLHFDPTAYEFQDDSELKKRVDEEAIILGKIIGKDIKSISLHNPSIYNRYPLFDNYVNAYAPKLFSDKNYIADSRMDFRGKNLFEFIEQVRNSTIQIVLHPFHYNEKEMTYFEIVIEHIENYINFLDADFHLNSAYAEKMDSTLLSHFRIKK
jgi:hypothetical protein